MNSKVMSVRVSRDEYDSLLRDAKDAKGISKVVRARLFATSRKEQNRRRFEELAALERVRANLERIARHLEKQSPLEAVSGIAALVASEAHLERLTVREKE